MKNISLLITLLIVLSHFYAAFNLTSNKSGR